MDRSETAVHGQYDPAFNAVRYEFARGFDEFAGDPVRGEIGATMAVFVGGRAAVDVWAGYADPGLERRGAHDTLANVFSTSKGITAIFAHHLLDKGRLDLDAPVAHGGRDFKART